MLLSIFTGTISAREHFSFGDTISPTPETFLFSRNHTPDNKGHLQKLADAVACHETGCGTRGAAVTANNAFGIRECYGGRCYGFVEYDSIEDSYVAFKSLWARKYGARCPTYEDAVKYSGNDRAGHWHNNVLSFYPCHV